MNRENTRMSLKSRKMCYTTKLYKFEFKSNTTSN